ncbi:MAG: GGDEF domain-containing protein, partial [Alphaproteobacteria bacterium]|nr:GGDEF domain-containing protein [Alphaproteobacteria bacterium]
MTISAGTIDLPFAGGFDLELPGEHAAGLLSHLRAFGDQAGLPRDSLRLLLKTLDYAAEMEQTIADQSARIVELEALAATDALTGLHNRRGFAEALRHTLKLAARHDETGILIYIDLDGFKGVNDAHGHDAGDSLLCRVAEVVSLHLRGSDIVARI